jgi:hypothetical protein
MTVRTTETDRGITTARTAGAVRGARTIEIYGT